MSGKKPRRPLTRAQLLDRMPRAFRPKLNADQRRDLALLHISNLDAIAMGQATEDNLWQWVGGVLTWSKCAELLELGTDEMFQQIELATRIVNRYRETGRVLFTGPDYQLAKEGVGVMDALADLADQPTASRAADWGEATLQKMAEAAASFRAQRQADSVDAIKRRIEVEGDYQLAGMVERAALVRAFSVPAELLGGAAA